MKLKITDRMRADWLMRKRNFLMPVCYAKELWPSWSEIQKEQSTGQVTWSALMERWHFGATKRTAIDRAIRAEHKAKEKR